MKPRNAIKTDLFAFDRERKKIDPLGGPLAEIESCLDVAVRRRRSARRVDARKNEG